MKKLCIVVLICTLLAPLAQAESASLTVMTFNIRYGTANDGRNHWDNRRTMVVDVIRKAQPDVLGTQECMDFQAKYLDEQLKDYTWLGIGRETDGSGEMMAVFYRRKRLTPLVSGTFWLSETPDLPGSKGWEAGWPRCVTWVKFYDHELKTLWLYANSHFDHRSEQARQKSARLLIKRLEAIAPDTFIVLNADFNARDTETEVYGPFHAAGYKDAWTAAQKQIGTPVTFNNFGRKSKWSQGRIDRIFYRGPIVAEVCETVEYHEGRRYPSDHKAIVATLKIELD